MHRGLPLVKSIKSVEFDSSESSSGLQLIPQCWLGLQKYPVQFLDEFECSVDQRYISICNAIVEISEVLEYSFPSLKVVMQKNSIKKATNSFSIYQAVIYGLKVNTRNSIKQQNQLHQETWFEKRVRVVLETCDGLNSNL